MKAADAAAVVADRLRHDLAMAGQDADRYAQGLSDMLQGVSPSDVIARGVPAIDELVRRLVLLVGSLEMARVTIKMLEERGVM